MNKTAIYVIAFIVAVFGLNVAALVHLSTTGPSETGPDVSTCKHVENGDRCTMQASQFTGFCPYHTHERKRREAADPATRDPKLAAAKAKARERERDGYNGPNVFGGPAPVTTRTVSSDGGRAQLGRALEAWSADPCNSHALRMDKLAFVGWHLSCPGCAAVRASRVLPAATIRLAEDYSINGSIRMSDLARLTGGCY